MFRNYRGVKWMQGKVLKVLRSLHYFIEYNGKSFKRHVDQLGPLKTGNRN